MCAKHWGMVNKYAQERVYAEYEEGQCTRDGGASPQWHSAADAAIYQVRIKELLQAIEYKDNRIRELKKEVKVWEDKAVNDILKDNPMFK